MDRIIQRFLILSLFCLFCNHHLSAQNRERIDILNADDVYIEKDTLGNDWHRLIGNVSLQHNDLLMQCDSAHFFPISNDVKAFQNIHFHQGDTLHLYGNLVNYNGSTQIAEAIGNVELINKETHLFSNRIFYNRQTAIATYPDSGRIISGDNILKSKRGTYYTNDNHFFFKDSVEIQTPEYLIVSDTMQYNTETKITHFFGDTDLSGDSLLMHCQRGWYDTENRITTIWQDATVNNMVQFVSGDSIFYNDFAGVGEAFNNVSILDSTNSTIVSGNYCHFSRSPETFLVTDNALYINFAQADDTLFLHADTLQSVTKFSTKLLPRETLPRETLPIDSLSIDSLITNSLSIDSLIVGLSATDSLRANLPPAIDSLIVGTTTTDSITTDYRIVKAYHNCKIFSNNLQAVCDSLTFSFLDSAFRLYSSPIIWNDSQQMTADSIALFTKDMTSDRIELYNSAFIAIEVDFDKYNQIKGRKLTGYFEDNALKNVFIDGNGETIYYLVDGNELVGVNSANSSTIDIYLEDNQITEIYQKEPTGEINPPILREPTPIRLDGFEWHDKLRPKQLSDIFTPILSPSDSTTPPQTD